MKVKREPLDIDVVPPQSDRSIGHLHMSDIYNDFYKTADPNRYDKNEAPNDLYLALGLAWEQYFERLLIAHGVDAKRPPAFETANGIKFSPDLLVYNGQDRLGEIKLTFMSVSEDLSEPKFAKYLTQAMLYAHGLKMRHVVFYVLFVNGDYKANRGPQLYKFYIEFSQRELDEEWDTMMAHAKQMGVL